MERVQSVVRSVVQRLRGLLQEALDTGGFSRERYVRYLSMQHHLTNGVPLVSEVVLCTPVRRVATTLGTPIMGATRASRGATGSPAT